MHGERGSAVLLLPVCLLILLVLASLTVDYGHAFLAQRELANAVASAANDGASAIDAERFYGTGIVVLDPTRAEAAADDALRARGTTVARVTSWVVTVLGDDRIQVAATGEIDTIFSRALHAGVRPLSIRARATAQAALR